MGSDLVFGMSSTTLGGLELIAKGINAQSSMPPINALGRGEQVSGCLPQTADRHHLSLPSISRLPARWWGKVSGKALTTAASPVVQQVGEALQAQPVTQAVAAGTSGAMTEATGAVRCQPARWPARRCRSLALV